MADPISADQLVRRCDPAALSFVTTAELEPLDEMVGQDRAVEAVAFGVAIHQPGFNLYAMGPEGTGKASLLRSVLAARAAGEPVPNDWCYVHNFVDPRRPRAIQLPAGEGRRFRDRIAQLERELRTAIPAAFESDEYRNRREAIETGLKERRDTALGGFEERASARGLALLRTPIGVGLAPVRDGKVMEREELEQLPDEERQQLAEASTELEAALGDLIQHEFPQWEREARLAIRETGQDVAGRAVRHLVDEVRRGYLEHPEIKDHLGALETDVIANAEEFLAAAQPRELPAMLAARLEDGASFRRYGVNLLVDHADTPGAPVVFEDLPTQPNLLGRIEHSSHLGALITDFTLVRPGALHLANGGYLVLDARRLLTQPFAWEELKRALRAGEVRIESLGDRLGLSTVSIEPAPIPLDAKVVLVGDRTVYYLLAELDPDFLELFKVQVDFEDDVPRTTDAEARYGRLLATIAARSGLRPMDAGAVAAVIERAARITGDADRLSTHMRRLTDLLREADDRAGAARRDGVTAHDVRDAVEAARRRASRIQERTLEQIERGTVLVATTGEAIGQVNGLSVMTLGETSFGRPARITASVRLGDGDIVDIEREVKLGGPIHSKGVLILAGLLGSRYGRTRPLSLHASLVFEQSYGGVEGDSASLAEACALLSAIGEIPLRQSLALTGSLNQQGEVQPIGGVNEKIEGFFDVCAGREDDGSHAVVIPATNLPHLMLRDDVVEAARDGRFAVYAVGTIDEAMALLTGLEPAVVNDRVAAGLDALTDRAMQMAARARGDGGDERRTKGRRRAAAT